MPEERGSFLFASDDGIRFEPISTIVKVFLRPDGKIYSYIKNESKNSHT
ncbi:MAG: hypothetical protein ACP5QD_05445 [Candidatus Ratteibacteria bacterium]